MLRFQRAGDDVGIVQYSVPDCHFRQHGKTKTIIHHLHQRVQRRSHYGSLGAKIRPVAGSERSEEHTSELQSLMRISYAVFCLKKKNRSTRYNKQVKKRTQHISDQATSNIHMSEKSDVLRK